jgi:anti-sigma factor RsiW
MCPNSEELSAYHDGAIDADRSRQIELHARTCSACAGELADLRRVSQWLARQRPEPSPAAVRRVVEFADTLAERNEAPTLGTLRRVGRVLTGLAASVVVFGVIRLAQRQQPPTTGGTRGVAVAAADWEEVVLRRNGGESSTPEQAEFADWIVSGLSRPSQSSGGSQP